MENRSRVDAFIEDLFTDTFYLRMDIMNVRAQYEFNRSQCRVDRPHDEDADAYDECLTVATRDWQHVEQLLMVAMDRATARHGDHLAAVRRNRLVQDDLRRFVEALAAMNHHGGLTMDPLRRVSPI